MFTVLLSFRNIHHIHGYPYIIVLDMDMDMDVIIHLHGKPANVRMNLLTPLRMISLFENGILLVVYINCV